MIDFFLKQEWSALRILRILKILSQEKVWEWMEQEKRWGQSYENKGAKWADKEPEKKAEVQQSEKGEISGEPDITEAKRTFSKKKKKKKMRSTKYPMNLDVWWFLRRKARLNELNSK